MPRKNKNENSSEQSNQNILKSSKIGQFSKNQSLCESKYTEPAFQSAQVISSMLVQKGQDSQLKEIPQIKQELKEQLEAVKNGNLECLEEMLLTQAITLNSAFNKLLKRGEAIINEPSVRKVFPGLSESTIKLALKCQTQSRQTIQALGELKNPKKPTQFIKNYVDKQVNQLKLEREEELKPSQLGEANNAPMDIESQAEAKGSDLKVETLEAKHGTKNNRRKTKKLTK